MLAHTREIIAGVDRDPSVRNRQEAIDRLRGLGLDDFGVLLLSMPNADYPKLSALLPAMASDDVQQAWTGSSGLTLLRQTCNFTRSLAFNYSRLTRRDLGEATILDYGCGYGRILRLMNYFVPEERIYGVDPWDQSLQECRKCGLNKNLALSDYYPSTLTVEASFDLIYAFSVFTHTSELATRAAFAALRRHIIPDGLLAITIRPVEYWDLRSDISEERRCAAIDRHRADGFAFLPHDRPAFDGDIPYGDTSITAAWIERNLAGWRIVGNDRSLDDEMQVYMFLKPR